MPKINKEIESQIQLAMESLSKQSKPNIRKTAREFAVPKGRLRRRWKGGKSFFQRQPNGRKLSTTQEGALCEYIDYFNTVGPIQFSRKIIITNLYYHHKSATTSYSVFLNVILSTTFQISVGRDQFIITRYPKKKLFNRSITNRKSITVLEAVSANSFVCPPLIILSAKQALLRWFNTIKEDKYLAITNTSYINNTLAYQ
ncbi:hypothetical protein N7527_010376 [Penicillium freii]|nr:hypothetical protein N7527_010376 [Penicillium freii]